MHGFRPFRFLIPFIVVFAGCASISEKAALSKFRDTARNYEAAILWSRFDAADNYIKPDGGHRTTVDRVTLKKVKVSQYEVKQVQVAEDKQKITQLVEIQYFLRDRMILKTITDVQRWEYDAEMENWFNLSGLPAFR